MDDLFVECFAGYILSSYTFLIGPSMVLFKVRLGAKRWINLNLYKYNLYLLIIVIYHITVYLSHDYYLHVLFIQLQVEIPIEVLCGG